MRIPHLVGYQLLRQDGTEFNKIRADLIPEDALVITQHGRHFVVTRRMTDDGFRVFRENHRTYDYVSNPQETPENLLIVETERVWTELCNNDHGSDNSDITMISKDQLRTILSPLYDATGRR